MSDRGRTRGDDVPKGSTWTLALRHVEALHFTSEAQAGQVLVSQRVMGKVEALVEAEPAGELELQGLSRPTAGFKVLRRRA